MENKFKTQMLISFLHKLKGLGNQDNAVEKMSTSPLWNLVPSKGYAFMHQPFYTKIGYLLGCSNLSNNECVRRANL